LKSNNWHGDGYGRLGLTQVSQWKWDENPEPAELHTEFMEFSETNNQE
jgi:hypothetical protein